MQPSSNIVARKPVTASLMPYLLGKIRINDVEYTYRQEKQTPTSCVHCSVVLCKLDKDGMPGESYNVAITKEGHGDCTCWSFLNESRKGRVCKHVVACLGTGLLTEPPAFDEAQLDNDSNDPDLLDQGGEGFYSDEDPDSRPWSDEISFEQEVA